jgi:hypothetical protein
VLVPAVQSTETITRASKSTSCGSHIVFVYGTAARRRRIRQRGEKLSINPPAPAIRPPSCRQKTFVNCEIGHRHHWRCRFIMGAMEFAESREIAMAMTAYFPFAKAHAGARSGRSKLSRFLDAMIEARRRKAEEEVAQYLRRHWYEFPAQIRDELANRGMGS